MTQQEAARQKSQTKIVDGVEIAYDDVGSGPCVVLLHGYPFNRSLWRAQVEVLSKDHRVIVPDLRGHGESAVMPAPATMELMAKDVAGLLESLDISHATIGGLSMGGYVALAFYRLFPSRVVSLILASTRAQGDSEEAKQNRKQQEEKALREGMEGIADGLLPKLLTPDTVAKSPEVVKQLRGMMADTDPKGAAAALQGMAIRQDQTTFLSRITVPTLILVGDEDAITPLPDAELLHREIKGSHLEVIAGAGHVLNLERPEEFNGAMARFIDKFV
ncbi:MAG TPA: alpha/beta fold hydrolase [Pyrinomonadaceae bacterium]|nr:alpha/beta fold hydrolase [Pyrinomonadaceae bacterium]